MTSGGLKKVSIIYNQLIVLLEYFMRARPFYIHTFKEEVICH